MYEIAIMRAGMVSGILERDKSKLFPQKERFAQKKASGSPTNIANKEEKKECVIVKVKIEAKDELILFIFFRIESSDEKNGLKEAKRGNKKKIRHIIKERKPKNKIIFCKNVFIAVSLLSFLTKASIYFEAFMASSIIFSIFLSSNFNIFFGDGILEKD